MNLSQIRAAKDGAALRDDEVRGLEVRVRGEAKAFYLYYRTATGVRRRPKIGDWPTLTLQQARDIAREMLGEVARGKDPSADRQARRGQETIAQLCDRYISDYAKEHKRSWTRDQARIETVIKPRWGDKRVAELTVDDLKALRRSMSAKQVTFNRTRSLVSKILSFAHVEPNVARMVSRYREEPRKRYLQPDEAIRLAKALDEVEALYPHAIAVIRLLMLTGARLSEIIRAKRAWYVDGVLTLDDHKTSDKTGAKEIVFPPAAQAVVAAVDARNGWLVGFSSRPNAAWDMVVAKAKLAGFTLHDLRHSFASEALAAGYTLDQIGELFGHRSAQTTRRYAHLIQDKRRSMANDVAERIGARMAGKA